MIWTKRPRFIWNEYRISHSLITRSSAVIRLEQTHSPSERVLLMVFTKYATHRRAPDQANPFPECLLLMAFTSHAPHHLDPARENPFPERVLLMAFANNALFSAVIQINQTRSPFMPITRSSAMIRLDYGMDFVPFVH